MVLQDQVNRDWMQQLVSFPVAFEEDQCRADSIALRGPDGPVAGQLTNVETWPGTDFVKSATLWFVGDAPRLTRNTYTLSYGPESTDLRKIAPPGTDLNIRKNDGNIELTTSHFGIRLIVGHKAFAQGVEASDVPEPVLAFRDGAGNWFGGGGGLYGPLKIVSYDARLVEEGPVLARWAVRYTYVDNNTLELIVTLAAGDNTVFFEQRASTDLVDLSRTRNSAQAAINGRGPADNGLTVGFNDGLAPLALRCWREPGAPVTYRPFFIENPIEIDQWADIPLGEQYPAGLVMILEPWRDSWSSWTQTVLRLKRTDRPTEFRLRSWDAGEWVDPSAPGTHDDEDRSPDSDTPLVNKRRSFAKQIPIIKDEEETIFFSVSALAGMRKWSFGEAPVPEEDVFPRARRARAGTTDPLWHIEELEVNDPRVGRGLDIVKDWVLDWEEPADSEHPRMFISAERLGQMQPRLRQNRERVEELMEAARRRHSHEPAGPDAYALAAFLRTGDLELGRELELAERLGQYLDTLAHEINIKGGALHLATLYDGVIDTDLVTPEQRKLFRAQMAYAAYVWGDPATWSTERGYSTGNPNMMVVVDTVRGLLGCMLRTHPMSDTWVQSGVEGMKRFMAQVGPKGEWMESMHYSHVTASMFVAFAVAARQAGVHDFFADKPDGSMSDLKRMMRYLAQVFSPADPRRGDVRVGPAWGRSNVGRPYGHSGVMAFATADTDPAYSKEQQWLWRRTGYSLEVNHYGQRFGGFSEVCADRSLPEVVPDWRSKWFPLAGVIMRHGLGTEQEHYLGVLTSEGTLFVRGAEAGAIMTWYSRGVPISTAFTGGYDHRHQMFMSTVQPARQINPKQSFEPAGYLGNDRVLSFAALPPADYLHYEYELTRPSTRWYGSWLRGPVPQWPPVAREGNAPMRWQRQLMLVKDADPAKASYVVLRDTVRGNQPSMWQFWTLSEEVGTPEKVRDRQSFLSEGPGMSIAEPRRLTGDRFTAVGQFNIDIEYYIAAPADGPVTPRHTLRYGDSFRYPISGFEEYQDLLHVQLPGDGHYFVVVFPRLRSELAPEFETLGDGTIIRVSGDFGTDYCFLPAERTEARAGNVEFSGTVGSVQDRRDGLVLAIGAAGEVRQGDWGIASEGAASLSVGMNRLTVNVPHHRDELSEVTLRAPGQWRLGDPDSGVTLESEQGAWKLTMPAGMTEVTLLQDRG